MDDQFYMQRALDLAALGRGSVSPNPLVGCVIVHDNKIIGEGWHKKYGESHAEVNAIHSVENKGLLKDSTVFVTLEPCAHFGKTPPCADLLVHHHVKKVVISVTDPNPLVGGKGIQKLQEAGIEVETGILEAAGKAINKRFFNALHRKRPYIILKWAETADGFMARKNYDSKWISSGYSRMLVHKWRTEEDAILVGSNTAAYDNPQLGARNWKGRSPIRIVIDRHLKLNRNLQLFDGSHPTICYNLHKDEELANLTLVKLDQEGFLNHMMDDLFRRKIHSVLVEGGAIIHKEFLGQQLWDEVRVFKAPVMFREGIAAPTKPDFPCKEFLLEEGDKLLIYENESSVP